MGFSDNGEAVMVGVFGEEILEGDVDAEEVVHRVFVFDAVEASGSDTAELVVLGVERIDEGFAECGEKCLEVFGVASFLDLLLKSKS